MDISMQMCAVIPYETAVLITLDCLVWFAQVIAALP